MKYLSGLKSKITIAVSLLVMLLMSTVAYVMHYYVEKQFKATIAQDQFVMVTALADEIDRKLTSAHGQLIAASHRVPLAALKDPDQAQAFLDTMTGLQRIFDNDVLILTPDGKLLAESPFLPNRRGKDLSFRPYYKRTMATKAPFISDPYRSTLAHKHPAIMMTAPILNAQGAVAGILLGSMDLMGKNILQGLSRMTIGRTGYQSLTTRENRIRIVHPDHKLILKAAPPGVNPLFDQAVAGFEGSGETVNVHGVPILTSYKRLKTNDWILGANYPIAEAHALLFDVEKKLLVITVAGIICVVLIVFYLIKRLTSPLVVFTRHVEALSGKSGADRQLNIVTNDEIGTLSHAFNQMISELDRQKETLQQSENRLQDKNSELERFTYTVSHDLKSPLVTIKSFSGAIKSDLASGRHDRIEKDLDRVCSAVDRMAALLDDLLKLSRVGHVISTPEPVDMAQLVDDVLNTMAGTLKENDTGVIVQPGLPTVMCDRQRMMEVLQNLVENAVKYRGDQPEPRIVVGLRQENGRQVFCVQDNGPGIAPRYHENIFGLFNRLDTRIPGTGIGLALVKRIIETHGGSVWVESDGQGNGSTFCFTVGG